MKYIIALIISIASFQAQAQFGLACFKDTITISIPNDTIAGMPIMRKAQYECLIDNRRTGVVTVQAKVYYYATNGQPFPASFLPPKAIELNATQDGYVRSTGEYIGKLNDVQERFGTYDSTSQTWSYSEPGIMPEADFYVYISTQPMAMRQLILAALNSSTKLKVKEDER